MVTRNRSHGLLALAKRRGYLGVSASVLLCVAAPGYAQSQWASTQLTQGRATQTQAARSEPILSFRYPAAPQPVDLAQLNSPARPTFEPSQNTSPAGSVGAGNSGPDNAAPGSAPAPASLDEAEQKPTPIGTGPTGKPKKLLTVDVGVSVGWTASSNLARRPVGSELSGQLLEVNSYFSARLMSPTSSGSFFAALNYERLFELSDGNIGLKNDGIGGRVTAKGDFSIVGDGLRVAAAANLLDGSGLVLGLPNEASGSSEFFASDYSRVSLRPYSKGSIGQSHEYRVGYELLAIRPGSDDLRSTSNRIDAQVGTSGFSRTGLGWSWRFDAGDTSYQDDRQARSVYSELVVDYLIADRLRLGAGINFASIDDVFDAGGKSQGIGPTVLFEWRPARTTKLSGRLSDAYFGPVATFSFAQNLGFFSSKLTYAQGIEETNVAAALLFEPRELLAIDDLRSTDSNRVAQGLIDRNAALSAGELLAVDSLQSPLVYNRSLAWTIGYLGRRSELLASLYSSRLEAAIDTGDIAAATRARRNGLIFSAGYSLSRRQKLVLGASYRQVDAGPGADQSTDFGYSLRWAYRLSRQLSFGLTFRGARSSGDIVGSDTLERAIKGVFDYRF